MKRAKEALAKAHPDEPWLWDKAWADGRIRGSAVSLFAPLIFAGVWNTFCAGTWFAFLVNRSSGTNRTDEQVFWWFAVPFTIIGLLMLGWAFVSVRRWLKYGRSVFEMASLPGVIGGQLAGVIRTPVKIEPEDVFRITLSCTNCVTRRSSGADDSISRNIIWQDEQAIARDLLAQDANHSAIPVLFQIPYECRPTDDSDPNSLITWTLEVTAKTRGIDYLAEFTVPVFKTPQSAPHFVVDRSLIAQYAAPEDPGRDLHDAGVAKTPSASGEGCRFVFPMARHPGVATFFTVGSLVFFAAPSIWLYFDFGLGALAFGGIFGLVGAILAIAALDLWFYRSVVDVSSRGLMVAGGLFGYGTPRWIEASEVTELKAVSQLQSEKLVYYNLVIFCRGGKRITAGKRVLGRRLAVGVIRQIEQAMGKQEAPVAVEIASRTQPTLPEGLSPADSEG